MLEAASWNEEAAMFDPPVALPPYEAPDPAGLQREFEGAVAKQGHHLRLVAGWLRCMRCRRKTRPKRSELWERTHCSGAAFAHGQVKRRAPHDIGIPMPRAPRIEPEAAASGDASATGAAHRSSLDDPDGHAFPDVRDADFAQEQPRLSAAARRKTVAEQQAEKRAKLNESKRTAVVARRGLVRKVAWLDAYVDLEQSQHLPPIPIHTSYRELVLCGGFARLCVSRGVDLTEDDWRQS